MRLRLFAEQGRSKSEVYLDGEGGVRVRLFAGQHSRPHGGEKGWSKSRDGQKQLHRCFFCLFVFFFTG